MAKKKTKRCRSKWTGRLVSCKRQRAARKAARSGTRKRKHSKRRYCTSKWTGKRVSCKRQRAGKLAWRRRR